MPWQECARIVVAASALCCCVKWPKSYTAMGWLGAAPTGIAGYPLFKSALASALRRQLTGEFSLALAVLAALCIGESSMALAAILFTLLARTIAEKAIARGRRSLSLCRGAFSAPHRCGGSFVGRGSSPENIRLARPLSRVSLGGCCFLYAPDNERCEAGHRGDRRRGWLPSYIRYAFSDTRCNSARCQARSAG